MRDRPLKKNIEIWIKEDFILPEIRPIPLLIHASPPDTNPELDFWNVLREKLREVVHIRRFKNLAEAGSIVTLPNPLEAYNFTNPRILAEVYDFNRKVLASGRTLVLFTGATEYKPQPKEIVFSTVSYRSSEKSIPTPGWLYDLGSKVSPMKKPPLPTVGFVGNTEYSSKINALFRYVPILDFVVNWMACSSWLNQSLGLAMRRAIAKKVREKTINEALKASNLKTSFLQRNNFYFSNTEQEKKHQREEYIQNIQNNAYTLCVRGSENFSYRLYEVMSAGRIPIIIDTNMRLPALGTLDWSEFSVIVPYAELPRIGEIVQAFHDNLSDEDFREACRKSRAAFEYLLPHNFIWDALKYLECK